MRNWKKVIGVAAAAAMTAAMMMPTSVFAADETFKIGVIGPMTGDYAQYGTNVYNAAKIAADEINENGGFNGYKVEILDAGDDQGDPEKAVEQATVSVPDMEMGWGELEEVRPTPIWIEVLGKLVFWSIVVALIVAVLVSIVLLFRWMIKSFYQTDRGRKETLEAGVEEKTESIAYREKRKRAQLFIGIEPSAKIRRAYKKTIEGAFGRRQKKKEQERKEAVWLGLANSLTAQELTRQAWGDTGHEDWEQLTELYEQARYGGTEPEREQARAAVKLSGKILHMIKKK